MLRKYNIAQKRGAKPLGFAIRDARLRRGLSQSELAEQVGSTRFVISRLENGEPAKQITMLLDLFRALGLDLSAEWIDD